LRVEAATHIAPDRSVIAISPGGAGADPEAAADARFCRVILPQVSRTFALGIRLLPRRLSRPVAISYLICRIADTVEDSWSTPAADRSRLLDDLVVSVAGRRDQLGPLGAGLYFRSGAEARLLDAAGRVLREFHRLPDADQDAITPWVEEMIEGMKQYLVTSERGFVPLFRGMDQLLEYCYFVAGTIGQLLTELFRNHVAGVNDARYGTLKSLATDFGLSLQLTNVIRDLPEDRREGRNYIPEEAWSGAGVSPVDFPDGRSWAVVEPILREAEARANRALCYCIALPRSALRVRFFCLTSLFFARRTLALIRAQRRRLLSGERVKMTRPAVYAILGLTFMIAPSNTAIRAAFRLLGTGPGR
jgi:farnesyl-diphosphate farnesyltransferase